MKCNLPINGGRVYGSAQQTGILRDIDALLRGKSKGGKVPEGALRFMVFLDDPAIRDANLRLLRTRPSLADSFKILSEEESPDNPGVVYAVHTRLGG